MRYIILALFVSACAPYPKIDWPEGAQAKGHPTLLPQAQLQSGAAATDPGPALVSRAETLRAKVNSLAE